MKGDKTPGGSDRKRRVLLVAWFLSEDRRWLAEYLDPERYDCTCLGSPHRVDITRIRTGLRKWLVYLDLARRARRELARRDYDAVVTSFPQVGFALALINLLTFCRTPHIIWYFNCGHEYRGLRRWFSHIVYRRIERFIVYTHHERQTYARVFNLPVERFRFTYLTGARITPEQYRGVPDKYGLEPLYISSLGSSSRDWKTLFAAIEGLDIQTVIVTHAYSLEGCRIPPQVKVIESVSQEDYLRIIAGSRLTVIPVSNRKTASGQMTLIQAMSLRVPVIATRCIGTEDYIIDGETGRFIEMGDVAGMRRAITDLLDDDAEYNRIAENALQFAREHYFDSTGAQVLDEIVAEIHNRP